MTKQITAQSVKDDVGLLLEPWIRFAARASVKAVASGWPFKNAVCMTASERSDGKSLISQITVLFDTTH